MGFFSELTQAVKDTIVGEPIFGPSKPVTYANNLGRHHALRGLKAYLQQLVFYRRGGRQPDVPFHVHFFDEQPDNEQEMKLPAIGVLPGRGEFSAAGLGTTLDDASADEFGPGTVLQDLNTEYLETLQLEVWAASRTEREAIIAGLLQAFSPTDGVYGLTLRLPRYYNQTVVFTPSAMQLNEDQAEKNRRKTTFELMMRFNIVNLIGKPQTINAQISVDVSATAEITVDENGRTHIGMGTSTIDGPVADVGPAIDIRDLAGGKYDTVAVDERCHKGPIEEIRILDLPTG